MAFKTFKIYKGKVLSMDETINKLAGFGYTLCGEVMQQGDMKKTGDVLDVFCSGFDFPVRVQWEWDKVVKMASFDPVNYIFFSEHDILFILPVFERKKLSYLYEEQPLEGKLDLGKGDLVVHVSYGIGRYLGKKRLETKKGKKVCLEIEYRNQEKLYVPVEKSHFVQKYINLGGRTPRLSQLGSKEWHSIKERAKKSIHKYAVSLVRDQALRQILGGHSFSKDTEWQKDFEDTFEYEETQDQQITLQQVKEDMENRRAMDRLICGDVGYGKTEVAMRAAFKAVMDSKQVIFLVPTTILAEQHYYNFKERLEKFPVRVEMLSRFRNRSEQKQIVKNFKNGFIDVIIGTHRLLSKDFGIKDLGLFIIDEEQRFGVKQKSKIRNIKVGVDVITLTATPIPRTLYMGLTEIKDISIIKTPPKDRLAVKTYVKGFNKDIVQEAILNEYKRSGQVYFIENRIKDLFKTKSMLKKILPGSMRIGTAFGRMPASKLEQAMIDFKNKKVDCLISTAIIESGIDIPTANTLIVNNAHMFGLSDLHQLRGRVGRFNVQAYAYFLLPRGIKLSQQARRRIEAITEYAQLGAGFDLAMKDLEIRGAGNILGEQQHGFVWQIGLDLYCRLLRIEAQALRKQYKINKN